jgi:hypothetical protein
MRAITNEEELFKIQVEALEFTKANISTDNNWDLIFDLKRQLLMAERNHKEAIKFKDKQIERLANQLGEQSKYQR